MIRYGFFSSPFGELLAAADAGGLRLLYTNPHASTGRLPLQDWQRADDEFGVLRQQLDEYAAGSRRAFDIPLNPQGTPFQQRVWQELLLIPFGSTISYLELATRLGNPAALRAVGLANGKNPVFILIPCHRVIGSDGNLRGYAGGLGMKQRLLEIEGSYRSPAGQTGLFS